jgi:hydrogenase maturation protease
MKNLKIAKMLLIGIGNCSRRDDGLGWAFLDEIKKKMPAGAELIYKYQLNIEDAELISETETVVFIDAFSGELDNGFAFEKCLPVDSFEFTTHALSPGVIVSLCKNLYNSEPDVFVLKIQGTEWELKDGLSPLAEKNLEKALKFFATEVVFKKKQMQF